MLDFWRKFYSSRSEFPTFLLSGEHAFDSNTVNAFKFSCLGRGEGAIDGGMEVLDSLEKVVGDKECRVLLTESLDTSRIFTFEAATGMWDNCDPWRSEKRLKMEVTPE